jgi:hypothetical protein
LGRKLHADEQGISPVLGTALLLGIIVAASSIFLAVWVPSEVNRREREHMQGVEESFRKLGVMIEDLGVGENGSVDLKMGPGTIPLVPNPQRGGTLSVAPAENVEIENLEIIMKSDLGHVKFGWGGWSWVYESGMVIFVQDDVNLMKSPPGLVTVMQVDENNFEVHFNAFRVRGFEGSASGTGTSTITVSIPGEPRSILQSRENVTIWINSSYRDAWMEYLTSKVDELKAIDINAELENEGNLLKLTIYGGGKNIEFYQKVTDIEVRVD